MDEYEVVQHFSSEDYWAPVQSPNKFTDLDEAKARCDDLNLRNFGNKKGIADDYYGVIRTSDNVCVYPE